MQAPAQKRSIAALVDAVDAVDPIFKKVVGKRNRTGRRPPVNERAVQPRNSPPEPVGKQAQHVNRVNTINTPDRRPIPEG